ncbi:MAG: DUF1501 domain-containing protein, partial [Planctomycetales bacterium]|nr:DUF1501 domain-containing protein [Planctomycetales bacterium]
MHRRNLLKLVGAGGLCWLTGVAETLAWQAEQLTDSRQPKSIIWLWLAGGPSQLETFDPHPDRNIAGGTKAIATSVKSIQLAEGMEHTAEVLDQMTLIRSVVSKEGDHERAVYNMKTGYRPVPALIHPSIGAVMCHQLEQGGTEIPRHVSILPGNSPSRGGYLGDQYDAFQIGDPLSPLPDMSAAVEPGRFRQRLQDLSVIDTEFTQGRLPDVDQQRTL